MMTLSEDEGSQFKNILEDAKYNLVVSQQCLNIYEVLGETSAREIVNAYNGFFIPVIRVLVDVFIIKINNVVDSNPRAPSLRRLINLQSRSPQLTQHGKIDTKQIRKQLSVLANGLDAIKTLRNKRAAHWDVDASELPTLPLENAKEILDGLQDVLNKILGAYSGEYLFFKHVAASGSILDVMNSLEKYSKLRKELFTLSVDFHLYSPANRNSDIPFEAIAPMLRIEKLIHE